MKEIFEKPVVEVIAINVEDIVCTSPTIIPGEDEVIINPNLPH